ncbi:MAG: 16S rRNA (guanine(966)-N(2))-methyltransferase RsmD [Clostridia bacterium]|nr:16S rRNA (guanine(966)-N(2))-methyltransferase RsmD [Clostridia bacterium]
MRIISGKARGTKLYTLDGMETRPTLDRVKESLFNIIQSEIPNSVVLDLFSGSGAIGLEFASRGAKKVILCDNSKKATNIIEKNIEKTHLSDKVELYNLDFRQAISKIKEEINIVYLDPPYKTDYIKQALKELLPLEYINNNTIIIIETDEFERISNDIKQFNIKVTDHRKYGRANIIFIEKA